jgi:type II secretory pathway component GspD/PulD (secretin)
MGFMKKRLIYSMMLVVGGVWPLVVYAPNTDIETSSVDAALPAKHKKNAANKKKTFSFKFTDENLIDVINTVAEKKGVNVALPALPANPITSKVSISFDEKMTTDEAWERLIEILDIAGYSVVPSSGIYQIVKTTPEVTREALPIYINVPWEQLPDSEQRIRCVFYLSNIKVPTNEPPEATNDLYTVITKLLPNGQAGTESPKSPRLAFDPVTNAVIIAERASIVKSIMQIVTALDTTGFKEKIEMLSLYNTVALDVKKIFNDIMQDPKTNPYRLDARKPTTEATYFSKFVNIIPYGRLNMLIVLGREQAVDRVVDFIKKYIDVSQDSGQSVFHTYALQYLDAADFAPILQNIVNSASSGGTGQSRAEGAAQTQGGTERMFEGVIITHDRPITDQGGGGAGTESKSDVVYYGGNRLIIAARHDDWMRIKKLCEELDTPRPQVIIEVLVADLTLDDSRALGSVLRNNLTIPFIGDMQFQSAQLANVSAALPMVDSLKYNEGISPATVGLDNANHNNDVDILRDAYDASDNALTPKTWPGTPSTNQSIASQADQGTMAVSLIDPCTKKVWSLLEIRNYIDYRKILTNPHIVAVDNKQTELIIGESRLVPDAAVGNQGGNATVPKKKLDAFLKLYIKPRICLSPDGNPANDTVQLGIDLDINDFQNADFTINTDTNPNSGNRFLRHVTTSAHVRSREVIPLGGLLRRDTNQSANETPVLSKIPIIGYFFKNRKGTATDTALTVFLCPTVVRPRLRRGGVDRYTRDYVKLTKKYAQEGLLFDSLKDPVTRWFFNTESDVVDTVNDFLSDDEFKNQKEVRVVTKRSHAREEARRTHNSQELENKEMHTKDEDQRAMNEGVAPDEKAPNAAVALKDVPLEQKVIQEACTQDPIEVAAHEKLDTALSEERLKALIQNEQNPLQSYLPT